MVRPDPPSSLGPPARRLAAPGLGRPTGADDRAVHAAPASREDARDRRDRGFSSFVPAFVGLVLVTLLAGAASLPVGVRANGVGDLYVATPAGVAEVFVAAGQVLTTVPLRAAPEALVFDPTGRTLYAATGGRAIEPIDIDSLEATAPLSLPGPSEALAHPIGEVIVVAIAGERRLARLDPSSGGMGWSAELPGWADLLAADRRQPLVLAAESGKSWLALVDAGGDARPLTATVEGRVTAIAISRSGDLIVATRAPATVERRARSNLRAEWSVALPTAPDAVAFLAKGIVAASGRTLWWVDRSGAREWQTLPAPVTALAASDDGTVLYAATQAGLEALRDDGDRVVRIAIDLASGSGVLAPVPRPASLAGPGGPVATGSSDRPPATSTATAPARGAADLELGLAVALVVLVGGLTVARRLARTSAG